MRTFIYLIFSCFFVTLQATTSNLIKIETAHMNLIYHVDAQHRLYQCHIGPRLHHESDFQHLRDESEAYTTNGINDFFESALHIVHTDGNPSTLLQYKSHEISDIDSNRTETIIHLIDSLYPISVNLHYICYKEEDIVQTFVEISHQEESAIQLYKYASSMLHFNSHRYYLTEFSGNWANEAQMSDEQLQFGKKVLDSRLGTRANSYCSPFFQLALTEKATEKNGEIIQGTLGWTGNFRFVFEVDNQHKLRISSGINPTASTYTLVPNAVFRTPDFYFTYSANGKGQASRNFHEWARKYQVKKGQEDRMTLLNNWETTYFDFNEEQLTKLIEETSLLGLDMFLLDDGWFGNKYPRINDSQGLGDWECTKAKLPQGIKYLTKTAHQKGIKFGLWIEPEMVNPRSELYTQHRDWVIQLPNREPCLFRHQLVLDLTNPEVQEYVFQVVNKLLTSYPHIDFFKWDCNSPIANGYSPYLEIHQEHLYIEYVRGLYKILDRIAHKYPNLSMMLCSSGGARSDYEALKYFTEFWTSDNTDPIERLFIQWGFSQFFPAKTMCSHVTDWNKNTSIKFRVDVAMMGKLGFDINLSKMKADDKKFCKKAVDYYNQLRPIILDGDLYRLVSPYEGEHTASMYISKDKKRAVLFSFNLHPRYAEKTLPVQLDGLDANRLYRIKEINQEEGKKLLFPQQGLLFSGEYLQQKGLAIFSALPLSSHIFLLEAE